jgi:hypothetical protein
MSAVMLFALLLQAVPVVLLRLRLGRRWLRRPVTILVLASVVYQGVSPVLLSFPSIGQWDIYRQGVAQVYAANATLLLSAAMLAFTVAYLLARPERVQAPEADIPAVVRALDWRLLALSCAPLAVLTYEGRGYNGSVSTAPGAATGSELASSFFVILVALAAFSLVLLRGRGWFLPVLAAQSLLLAAAGERTPVIASAIVLIVLLCSAGMKPSARQLQVAGVLTVIAVLAISGVRAQQGRSLYYRDSGLGQRVTALASGVSSAGAQPSSAPGLLPEAAVRLDGTDFTAAVLQSESLGQPHLSPMAVPESLLIAVPSALWPSKIAHSGGLNPALTQIDDFGLQPVNFLPGFPGLYAGFLPWPWLVAFMSLLGALAGWGERWLLCSSSPTRLAMLASALTAALSFEQGLPGMMVTLRTGVILSLAVMAAGWVRSARPARLTPAR